MLPLSAHFLWAFLIDCIVCLPVFTGSGGVCYFFPFLCQFFAFASSGDAFCCVTGSSSCSSFVLLVDMGRCFFLYFLRWDWFLLFISEA